MPCGATVGTNGLKSWVIALSGELSMTSVLDAPAAPPDELVEPEPDEQAPSPAASRPVTATAMSLLDLRCVVAISAFLCFEGWMSRLVSAVASVRRPHLLLVGR